MAPTKAGIFDRGGILLLVLLLFFLRVVWLWRRLDSLSMDKGCHNDDNSGDDDDCFPLLRRSSCSLAVDDDTSRSSTTPPSPSSNGKFSFEQYAVEGWRWCSDETLAGSGAAVKGVVVGVAERQWAVGIVFSAKKECGESKKRSVFRGWKSGKKTMAIIRAQKDASSFKERDLLSYTAPNLPTCVVWSSCYCSAKSWISLLNDVIYADLDSSVFTYRITKAHRQRERDSFTLKRVTLSQNYE